MASYAPANPAIPESNEVARKRRRDEALFKSQLDAWLAHLPLPADVIIWYPHWDESKPTVVSSVARLTRLISGLPDHEFGGLKRLGSRGPWAQVRTNDSKQYLAELHTHAYPGRGEAKYFHRIIDVTAQTAAAPCWAWLRREPLPDGLTLEPRYVPRGSGLDIAAP